MSIATDVYKYLAADTVLAALLGATTGDTKIYPMIAPPLKEPPHIVYSPQESPRQDGILDGARIVFKITTPDYDLNLSDAIRDRLNALLDFKQAQQNLGIQSADYYIYNSERNGGDTRRDDVAKYIIKVINYDIVFVKQSF